MDLSKFSTVDSAAKGAAMEVLDPVTGNALREEDGSAVTITLLGADSPELRASERARLNKRLGKNIKQLSRTSLSAEQLEEEALETLITATKGWKGISMEQDGEVKELKCTPENARMLYTRLPWLREQADEFINDRANFLGN